jgi:alkanesulfonate monooxygenase SsuD/methylene tetrahydromethanopterin reductase-like flavin-dependent oxidoreductase (luciferase family)
MKFMYFFDPAIPGSAAERERLRPVARRTALFRKMTDEVVELAQFVEDLGVEAVTFPEHHLHTEGGEMGSLLERFANRVMPTYRDTPAAAARTAG